MQGTETAAIRGGILIVGNSHTNAMATAAAKRTDDRFHVVNLASFFDPVNRRNKVLKPELKELFAPDRVFCSFGGSEHNVFGLLEAPIKFDFMLPHNDEVLADRELVSYGLIWATLSAAMKRRLTQIVELRDMFDVSVTHICTPPPFREIAKGGVLPRVFHDKMHLGVSPASLRKKIYFTHSAIARHFCAEHGIAFRDPPQAASDSDGYLKPQYCSADPTHANAAYGQLVLDDILEPAHAGV